MSIRIKNTSGAEGTWVGQMIEADAYYDVPEAELAEWIDDADVFADVASGNLVINDGAVDILEPSKGWKIISRTQQLPLSDIDEGKKLAVHPSYKPRLESGTTYAVWTGAGDDVVSDPSVIGGGDLLHFVADTGTAEVVKEIRFDHDAFGRVWVHEAYLKFNGGGEGDYISADVMATGAPLQTVANLDLVIDGDLVKFAPGGPGTGTHGFADTPTLVPRTYSMDGDWDYDGENLTPNMLGEGEYQIRTVDTAIHRYVNKIPCYGSCPNYFSMTSDETAELRAGYFLRVNMHNVSDTNWHASIIMEIYRERTVDP